MHIRIIFHAEYTKRNKFCLQALLFAVDYELIWGEIIGSGWFGVDNGPERCDLYLFWLWIICETIWINGFESGALNIFFHEKIHTRMITHRSTWPLPIKKMIKWENSRKIPTDFLRMFYCKVVCLLCFLGLVFGGELADFGCGWKLRLDQNDVEGGDNVFEKNSLRLDCNGFGVSVNKVPRKDLMQLRLYENMEGKFHLYSWFKNDACLWISF